jgi:hypothetical protein
VTRAVALVLLLAMGTSARADSRVVIVASQAASRGQPSPRAMRRLLAARHGRVSRAKGYGEVSLVVTKIVSGTLDDPDYAARPTGVNALPVLLLDDAGYAAPDGMTGFAGTWTLTKLRDGTLVASAIGDTPWPAKQAAGRAREVAELRAGLHATKPEQRITALRALANAPYFELAPDAIALLDDAREVPVPPPGYGDPTNAGVVRDVAAETLHQLFWPLGEAATPTVDARREWEAYWKLVTTRTFAAPPIARSTATELAMLAESQSWPELAATDDGSLALGFSRLGDQPLDGHRDGVALYRAGKPTYVATTARGGVDAASGSAGVAVLSHDRDGSWRLSIDGKPETIAIAAAEKATHAAIAAGDTGFVVAYFKEREKALFVQRVDNAGTPSLAARAIPLPGKPNAGYHDGIHPVAIAKRGDAWIAAVEMDLLTGVAVVEIDASLAAGATTSLGASSGEAAQPRLAVAHGRTFAAWLHGRKNIELVTTIVGRAPAWVGEDVLLGSRPVALADGFAVAWIEDGGELHVARFDVDGKRAGAAVLQARDVSPFALTLARDGDALVVTYVDDARFPFALVARRVALAQLR